MQRTRFQLPQQAWGTTVTKYPANDAHVGSDDFTSGSKNFETDTNGTIQKRRGDINYEASPTSGVIKDLYEAVFIDGTHHLLRLRSGELEFSSGSGAFTSVTAGYSAVGNFEFAQYADRVYFGNGIDNPQVYDRTENYGGVAYTAPKTKVMGAQAPASAPTVAVGGAGNVPAGSYSYKITFLYYDFEESNGGTASAVVSPGVASQVNLTAVPVGGYGVTARKVYRSNNGGLSYALVGTINNNTATVFTDNSATATALMPVDNGEPRNFSLIVQHKDRLWTAGIPGDKSDLDFSAAGLPDIWPSLNTIICNPRDPITGLIVYNDRVMVFNRSSFGMILGNATENFRYSEVPGSIGCVDNRTLQVRVLHGVPILVWLSDKGFYAYNGSTVEYISDVIEDLVNFNIQQAGQVRGSNSQSGQSDFQSGFFVTNGGVDLTSNPGVITTPNPKYQVDEKSEWEGGSTVGSGAVTRRVDIIDRLAQVKQTTFLFSEGSASGVNIVGSTATLPVGSNYTGEDRFSTTDLTVTLPPRFTTQRDIAQPITFARAGVINFVRCAGVAAGTLSGQIRIWADAAGVPGGILYSGPASNVSMPAGVSATPNLAVSAGQKVWIGWHMNSGTGGFAIYYRPSSVTPFTRSLGQRARGSSDGITWYEETFHTAAMQFTFTQTALPASGTWTSKVYDSGAFPSAQSVDVTLNHSATYPALTSSTTYVDQADSDDMSVGLVSQSVGSLNGSNIFTFTLSKRYWRVRLQLSSSDDRAVPSITTTPTLQWPTTVTWVSQPIDGTLETSAMNNLVVNVGTLPAGTTVTAYVQKSSSVGGPYTDDFTSALSLGVNTLNISGMSNPTLRFNRVKLVLTNAGDTTQSAEVVSAKLAWTIATNFFSQVLDTGATPAGWDVFQASVIAAGAGVAFTMRSDAVSTNLGDDVPAGPFSPSFLSVTNGVFPTSVPVNRFVQWGLQMTATEDNVPVIDSVTINWFISVVNSLRPASIFYDKSYYVSLARYNSVANDLVLRLDPNGNWEIWEDQSIGTFSLFFGNPYFGDAEVAQVRKFLSGTDDHGNAIPLDVRFKAFDFDDVTKRKILRQVFLIVENTGAAYTVDYSLDRGQTFLPLYDFAGATTFTVPTDNNITTKRLVPSASGPVQGQTILLRIRENSLATVKIHEMQIDAYVRQSEVLNG